MSMGKLRRALLATSGLGIIAMVWGWSGAPASAASLEEAVTTALANNPRMDVVEANREATEQELRAARSLYLPTVDIGVGIGADWEDTQGTRASGGPDWLRADDAFARVTQRVFDGFEASSLVERETARVQSTMARTYENAEFLGLDVVGAYVEVQTRRKLVELSEQNVGIHQQILDAVNQLLETGVGNVADVTQGSGRLARAEATLEQARAELRAAESLYQRLVGQYPDNLEMVEAPLTLLPESLEAAVALLPSQSPTVKIFDAEVDAADAEIDVARSAYYPDVNIVGQYNHFENTEGLRTYQNDASVMLEATWNIFNGGANVAGEKEAIWRAAQARGERDERLLFARQDLEDSWYELIAAKERVRQFEVGVLYFSQTRDGYRQQFTVGQRTLLDVLDAENELFVTAGQLETERANVVRASYRILASLGQLLPTVGVEAPDAATREPEGFDESFDSMFDAGDEASLTDYETLSLVDPGPGAETEVAVAATISSTTEVEITATSLPLAEPLADYGQSVADMQPSSAETAAEGEGVLVSAQIVPPTIESASESDLGLSRSAGFD